MNAILAGVLAALVTPACAQTSLEQEMLRAHNSVRAGVGVKPLVWSDRLARQAGKWARALLDRNRFDHTPDAPYGENLFEIRGRPAKVAEVVAGWAAESRNYDYGSNGCRGVCGHYTQIVWRDTKEVGCGVAGDRKRQVWVCQYDPPGNWDGQRPY